MRASIILALFLGLMFTCKEITLLDEEIRNLKLQRNNSAFKLEACNKIIVGIDQ